MRWQTCRSARRRTHAYQDIFIDTALKAERKGISWMLSDNEDSCHLIENTYRDPKSNRRGRTEASQLDTALLIVVPRKKVIDGRIYEFSSHHRHNRHHHRYSTPHSWACLKILSNRFRICSVPFLYRLVPLITTL